MIPPRLARAWSRLRRKCWCDLGHDPAKSVILAATGRTGSTWVAELINHDNHYRLMFEPLAAHSVPKTAAFKWGQRIAPGAPEGQLTAVMEDILAGRISDLWTDQINRRPVATRRLIKFIRANLMLGWIQRRHPEIPIVLLVRHPCAVAHSMVKLTKWEWNLAGYRDQPALFGEILAPFRDHVDREMPLFDRHVTNWCIEYLVPLRELRSDGVRVVFYEDLCRNDATEARELLSWLGRPFRESAMRAFRRPSSVTRKESAIMTGDDPATGWMAHVGMEERRRAAEIMGLFGLDTLYGDDGLPRRVALDGWLRGE